MLTHISEHIKRYKRKDLFIANALFVFHFCIIAVILFGWIIPSLHVLYVAVLIVTLLCWVVLGYCPVTKWEFNIRRKYEPGLNYRNEYMEYYTHKFIQIDIPVIVVRVIGIVFLVVSLLIALNIFR